jgi:hypothetical protein
LTKLIPNRSHVSGRISVYPKGSFFLNINSTSPQIRPVGSEE